MLEGAGAAVPRFLDDVDGHRGAMGEQRHLALVIEPDERVPEVGGLLRQLPPPGLVPCLDGLRGCVSFNPGAWIPKPALFAVISRQVSVA